MASRELKITRIGNSRGVRLPAESLKRYGLGDRVIMEERADGILLRPVGHAVAKLTWEETARAIAAGAEDWSEWDAVSADGLAQIPWEPGKQRRVAESKAGYRRGKAKRK
ncbi:MAG: AbrB/MazE/SpoVT family DNA-binding domain-containing protein [Gemmatimonadales bacterium]|nr:AbrB/MazE/SpoVT family DNA-binding domain-containing protein [Gemmatimonadales bacterium]